MLVSLICVVMTFVAAHYANAQTTQCSNSGSCSVSRPTCYARQFYYYSRAYVAYYSSRYNNCFSCGFWGLGRCCLPLYFRWSYTAYTSAGAYQTIPICCPGYSGSPGSCTPICSGSSTCQNEGTCVQPNTCCCIGTRYSGPVCNTDADCDECQLNYHGCEHGCVNIIGSYTCTCRVGYELHSNQRNCVDINECSRGTDLCEENCHNTIGSYYCSCNTGYFLTANGYSCHDINECATNMGGCQQVCVNTPGGFHCACNLGYTLDSNGITCTNIDECAMNNGGCEVYCTDTPGSFMCSCDNHEILDATGLFCDGHDECETGAHDCEQTCHDLVLYWRCGCYVGYSLRSDGRTCQDINECLTNNGGCQHTCTNSIGSYTCSCDTGYTLDTDNHRCIDIDECLDPAVHGCQHNCVNTLGAFHCTCDAGYTLDVNGITCTADPCAYQLVAPDNGMISCTGISTDDNCTFGCDTGYSLFGEYIITCLPNHLWSAAQPICTILTCDDNFPMPPENGHVVLPCSNAFGQTCHIYCDDGYQLERGTTNRSCTAIPEAPMELFWTTDITTFCGDVDECQVSNGGCSCEENIPREAGCFSRCNNTMGSFYCICTPGFVLEYDNITCQDHDECALTDHGCEHQCVNTHGTYMCICNWGYRLDSDMRGCSDIDECAEGISGCNQTCTNIIGNYSCSCEPNLYTLNADGHACDDVDECLTNNGGCDHFCHNYYGGHRCSCRPGYTLQDDGRECIADPCEPIAAPQNGSIVCTSGMVGGATDDNCTFSCHLGFSLENANHRTCLPDHTWSGVETYCRILQCPNLLPLPDSSVRLPCAREFTSFCTMDCDPDYYLVGNTDRLCLVVNNVTNEVGWVGQHAECDPIRPCAPTPCLHNARCFSSEEDYYCDCRGTGYTGDHCEMGRVEFPISGFPTLLPGTESDTFTIFASPDDEIWITPIAINCTFTPAQINITAPDTSGEFSCNCWGSGAITVNFMLDGANAVNYITPPPLILYIIPGPRPVGEPGVFERLTIPEGTLPAGSYDETVTFGETEITFSSTSEWCRDGDDMLTTTGIVYLESNGFTVPTALQGATINSNTLEVEYTDPSAINESCSVNAYSANDVEDFISQNALANQYFDSIFTLSPSWLEFSANAQNNIATVGENEFVINVEPGSEVVERAPCSSLPIETENLCVVLPYTGSLQVVVGRSNITFESQNGICFVSSVIGGASSPIFIGGFDDQVEQNALSMLDFMEDLTSNGWNVELGSVGLGNAGPVAAEMTFDPFRTSTGMTTDTLPAPDVWMNGNLNKQFGLNSASGFRIGVNGDAYLDVPSLANILDGPPSGDMGQWTCVATGNIEVDVNFELQGAPLNLTITGSDTQILSIFGGFPRNSITNPAGIFFRGSGQLSPSLFNQYGSNIDVYITLNENNEATGLGCIITGCIYITSSLSLDNLDIEVNTFNWSTPIDNPLWFREGLPDSQFYAVSRPEQEIVLNSMITILADRGIYTEPSIIMYYPSTAGGSYTGYCYSRVNVFGATIDTTVTTIDNYVYISSPGAIIIFDSYPVYLWCRADLTGSYSWNELQFEITGYFDRDSVETTLFAEVTQTTWNSIVTMANVSKQRHVSAMEALGHADTALSAKKAERNAAQTARNASIATLAAARANVTRTNNTLNRIRQQVSDRQPQIDNTQSLMNTLCMPIDCPTVCLPSLECVTCTESIEGITYSKCDSTCYEDVAIEIDPGTATIDCWESGELALPQVEASCEWRSSDYIDYGCRSRRYNLILQSSQPSRCNVPALDYPYTADIHSYDCQMACESLPQIINILYTCCSTDSCGIELNPAECLLYNQACRTYRNEALTNGTHEIGQDIVSLFTMETDAEDAYNAAVYSEMVANQMADMADEMLNTIQQEFSDSLANAVAAQNQLNNITNEVANQLVVYDYLQDIPDNTSLEILNISFATLLNVRNPHSLLRVTTEYKIGEESDSTYIKDRAYGAFDFSRSDVRDLLVYDLMSSIVRSISNRDQALASKRDVSSVRQRRQQIINPTSNLVLSQFQGNCITLQNAEEALEDLIASLGRVNTQYQMSYNNLWNLMNELVMLQSNYSASGIGSTMFVDNATYLNDSYYTVNLDTARELGIDVMAISNRIADSTQMMQAREIINNQINIITAIMQNLGYDIFEDWSRQIRSIILGAQTGNCYSFHDCSSSLINEIRDILASTPVDLIGPLRDTFEQTAQEFLEVASSDNLTVTQAYNRAIGLARVIARLHNVSYWCVVPPAITDQPRPFGSFTVGQFYFISCVATGSPPPTYTWWKDGEIILGATNTTLYFNELTRDDEGIYTCVATNLVHSVRSMPAIVKVDTIPSIFYQPEDVDTYVCSANGATFQVNATGIPEPQYQWYFQHITSTIFTPLADAVSSVLFIPQPQADNEGTYYCNISNSRGSVATELARLHLLQFEVTRLSAVVTFTISNCSRSSADHTYSYNSVGSQPVDYSTAFYEVVVEALNNLTNINLLDPLNFYREFDITEHGGRIEIDIVTPSPDISDSDCADIITIAEYLTIVSRQLNVTLTTFRDEIENILFWINGVAYCIDPQPIIRPDEPLCPTRGGAQFGGVLCSKCPPGSYQTEDRDTGVQICQDCPKGMYQTEIGQTQCTPCPPNRTTEFSGTRSDARCFLPCEPGYTSVNGLETAPRGSMADCRPCGIGYYQPDPEKSYCIQCSDGDNTSSIASTKPEQCIRKCDPGCVNHEHGLTPCQKCQKGQYIGYHQSTFCFTCPEGQSTLPFENSTCGATSINDCKTVCLPGSYSIEQTGLVPCRQCSKDFYQAEPNENECMPCNNLYGTIGTGAFRAEDCLKKCGPGNYSMTGFEPCTLCPQGEYQEDYEQYKCVKCRPGTTTGYIGTVDDKHCIAQGQIPSNYSAEPFPMDTNPANVPAIPAKVAALESSTSSTHDNRNRIVGIAVGVSVAVLVIIGIIFIASMIYFRSRSSDPITVKHRELSDDKAVLWTSGTGNLRVEPINRMSRISTATNGFSNPVYSMEDAISTCETDNISGDLVHNPVYMDDDMLQHDSALKNPLYQGDEVSVENSFYDEVDEK